MPTQATPTSANADPVCWVISDGASGNERQVLALAEALNLRPRVLRIKVAHPWDWFAPNFALAADGAIRDEHGQRIAAPWPDIAIGCGRRAALLTRLLREWTSGRCFTVQILDPRIEPARFDVVIAPRHDELIGRNVIHTIGALNPVDADWLAAGRACFPQLLALPSPRTAVMIGATTHAQRIDEAYCDGLLAHLAAWHASDHGSFLISVSRRTPPPLAAHLRAAFAQFPGTFWADADDGENPYVGYLGWADRIVVTPDSVNMISEACATGKPVYTFAPQPIRGKLALFHRELHGSGHLRRLDDSAATTRPDPLNEMTAVAELVQARWLARAGVNHSG